MFLPCHLRGFFRIVNQPPVTSAQSIPWNSRENLLINNKKISFSRINSDIFHNRKKFDKFLFHNSIDCDTIPLSAVFRTRRQGDFFQPPKRNLTKSVKKLFIEMKIPREERDGIIMLADGSEILWIEGIGVSEKSSVKGNSKNIAVISSEKI